ncbi:DUF4272 domain-containing protein [Marinicella litoralis]|uniref:Uncharacterized protein DUF4272 n=1 Tax=Marinicella litoralis TaxID=644220 RepID=A0A4R6XXD6_9GAMM|nr:DUF4272 domain-containing protein [Marinicella litoralis]TDR23259.1 uncharacterized protein DUF4272 [Marinicella litoralis]
MFTSKISPEKVKAKNTKVLKKQGIEVIEHLPYLDLMDFRSPEEVAKRCVILSALLQLHFEAPNAFIREYLEENSLIDELSKEENKRLDLEYNNWQEQEKIDLYWSIEAIWALAWVGKIHDNLTFNTGVEETLASFLPEFQENEPAKKFITGFSLRSKKEIFSMLDRFYRVHWYARNLSLTGKKSQLVDIDIVMERRKALEWACNKEEIWEDISLDT